MIRIRDAGLGLYPYNAGNGIVVLGGEGVSLDMTLTALFQVGISGQPGALSIPVTPDDSFDAEQVADVTADAINALRLPGITATADPDTNEVIVYGATALSGDAVQFYGSIKDLAGNSIVGNQANGETRFTVFIGVGMDYGDAPRPYPTLREDNGARHVILNGFSLGPTVDVNADGQPSVNADGDALDEDGVVFDPTTPLVPSRSFTVTVSTSGIVNDVVSFGVLDAWIDFNRDGDWLDAGERVLANVILNKSAAGPERHHHVPQSDRAQLGRSRRDLRAVPPEHVRRLVPDGRSLGRRSRRLSSGNPCQPVAELAESV